MDKRYDVVVVGTQASGLLAGALLAKRGQHVAIVDNAESRRTYADAGFELPLMPGLTPALWDAPHVKRVHEALGLQQALMREQDTEGGIQAILPDHRLTLFHQRERLAAEFAAEWPELAAPLGRFFERLFALDAQLTSYLAKTPLMPPANWLERLQARAALATVAHLNTPFEHNELWRELPQDHPVRDILLGPLAFFGYMAGRQPTTFQAVRLLARSLGGVTTYAEQLGGLPALLLERAQDAGADVYQNAAVEQIEVKRRKLGDITLVPAGEGTSASNLPERLAADTIIANTCGPFEPLLGPDKLPKQVLAQSQMVQPKQALAVVNLVVRREAIPCGMGPAVFLLNGRRHPRDGQEQADPPLFVKRLPARLAADDKRSHGKRKKANRDSAPDFNPQDFEVISVACPWDLVLGGSEDGPTKKRGASTGSAEPGGQAEADGQWPAAEAMKRQVMARVRRLIPFLDEHLHAASVAKTALGTPHQHVLYQPKTGHALLGITGRPTKTHYRNLARCGREVLPGLGIEGEYLAAVNAVDRLTRYAGWNKQSKQNQAPVRRRR